jgi:SMI1 / KNR4 family (SUKH-1)
MIKPAGGRLGEFLASWSAASAEARRGASAAEVSELEKRYDVRLPEEFRAYFERANGMREGDMDDERLIHFYGLDRLSPVAGNEAGRGEGGRYFVFADFMIGSHEYAIALSGRDYGRIAIVDDTEPPRIVADSFVDFVDKYLHSPAALWRAK